MYIHCNSVTFSVYTISFLARNEFVILSLFYGNLEYVVSISISCFMKAPLPQPAAHVEHTLSAAPGMHVLDSLVCLVRGHRSASLQKKAPQRSGVREMQDLLKCHLLRARGRGRCKRQNQKGNFIKRITHTYTHIYIQVRVLYNIYYIYIPVHILYYVFICILCFPVHVLTFALFRTSVYKIIAKTQKKQCDHGRTETSQTCSDRMKYNEMNERPARLTGCGRRARAKCTISDSKSSSNLCLETSVEGISSQTTKQ